MGEVVCRILGKAISQVISPDLIDAAGSSQLCAGQGGGCEAAVHAVWNLFESPDCEGVLLVDAMNTINSLNCQTALRNILRICPSVATVAINSYRQDVPLLSIVM